MTITFNLNYATTPDEEMLLNIIVGNASPPHIATYRMSNTNGTLWQCTPSTMDANRREHIDYYYSLTSKGKTVRREWAAMAHRLDIGDTHDSNVTIYNHWNDMPGDIWLSTPPTGGHAPRHDGCTTATMATLRTDGSFGVGDIGDLRTLVDGMADSGRHTLRLAPIGDTNDDGNVRQCASLFALHPMYIDLRQLPAIVDEKRRAEMEHMRKELNTMAAPDHRLAAQAKDTYIRALMAQEGDRAMRTAAFKRFFKDNERWLVPYAQYSYLRDAYGTPDFGLWPRHREWTEAERGQLANPRTKAYKKLAHIYYTQFVLDQQMSLAHEYANKHGITLEGTLDTNWNPTGCDTWFDPEPIDTDGRQWWAQLTAHMARHFDALHITRQSDKQNNYINQST